MSGQKQQELIRSLPSQTFSSQLSRFTGNGLLFIELFDSLMLLGIVMIANGYTVQTILDLIRGDSDDKTAQHLRSAGGAAAGLYGLGILFLALGIGSYIYHKYIIYK